MKSKDRRSFQQFQALQFDTIFQVTKLVTRPLFVENINLGMFG